jgi:hypothetical protein
MTANDSAKEAAKPKKRGRGRPIGTTKGKKVAVTLMLPLTTKDQLDAIAEQTGINRGALVDQALQAQFRTGGAR